MKKKPRVLIVEDDEDLRKVVADLLDAGGYEVVCSSNGREALQLLVEQHLTPALILLDLRMPVMDGWEFARVVRCYRRLAEVPIVVITTPHPSSDWYPAVDGVLAKPFTPNMLMAEVQKYAPIEASVP